MATLLYTVIASLDGYTVDADGRFDWAEPSEDVHAHINAAERPVGTYLYGRRLYEAMAGWQTLGTDPGDSPVIRTTASSGGPRTRSSTRPPWTRCRPRGPGWSARSIRPRSGR